MSCVLRLSGQALDVDALLSQYPLPVFRFWKKGEPHTLGGKVHRDSGANFIASHAEIDEFARQVSEASAYLEQYAPMIARMVAFPGMQYAVLDFGVSLQEGYVAQFLSLPPKLIQLAASAGIGLEISQYLCCADDPTEP